MVKGDRSPVTVADFSSQALICRILRETFPGDPVVAEEDSGELTRPENTESLKKVVRYVREFFPGVSPKQICSWIDWGRQDTAQRFWTLDPIDGTKGFLRGDQYAIALALIEEGEVRLGILGCPNLHGAPNRDGQERGALFRALRSYGTVQTDLRGKGGMAIRVSDICVPAEGRLTESFESSHSDQVSQERIAQRLNMKSPSLRMDSQAKYAVLARGEASVYLRLPSPDSPGYRERIWDHAAGSIVIEEAGGRVTDLSGHRLDFSQGRRLEKNQGIVATNGRLHNAVLQAIHGELSAIGTN
jgi:3'(2'), 5'-bisphosphate nucleotidase